MLHMLFNKAFHGSSVVKIIIRRLTAGLGVLSCEGRL